MARLTAVAFCAGWPGWSFIEREIGGKIAKAVGGPLKWLFPNAPDAPVTCPRVVYPGLWAGMWSAGG